VRRRTFVLQVSDNKADVVPCELLQLGILKRIGLRNTVNIYKTGVLEMREVNAKTFETKVLKSILPVVVVIWGVG
jgi:hypothetical protein